ncbi:MAG: hypothetical protein MJD61_20460 [Proteobacteria bacterium]|nr:hypothetical protein [Pseudomonadota bacterium]
MPGQIDQPARGSPGVAGHRVAAAGIAALTLACLVQSGCTAALKSDNVELTSPTKAPEVPRVAISLPVAVPVIRPPRVACVEPRCDPRCEAGSGYANCDGDPATGCETALMTDVEHCGACERGCARSNAVATCSKGRCAWECEAFFADCDGDPDNGCEADLRTRDNCGQCGVRCQFPNTRASCAGGTCLLTSCDDGFADCDSSVDNGCETSILSNGRHCGTCDHRCSESHPTVAVTSCQDGRCASARCGDAIVNNGESCDNGNNLGEYGGCMPGCLERAPHCGDGEINGPERCDDGPNAGEYGTCSTDCRRLIPPCGASGSGCEILPPGEHGTVRIGGCLATMLTNRWALGPASCHPVGRDNSPEVVARLGSGEAEQIVPVLRVVRHPSNLADQATPTEGDACHAPGIDLALFELASPVRIRGTTRGYTQPLWPGVSKKSQGGVPLGMVGVRMFCLSWGPPMPGGVDVLRSVSRVAQDVDLGAAGPQRGDILDFVQDTGGPIGRAGVSGPCLAEYNHPEVGLGGSPGFLFLAAMMSRQLAASSEGVQAVSVATPGTIAWIARTLHSVVADGEPRLGQPLAVVSRREGELDVFSIVGGGRLRHEIYREGSYRLGQELSGLMVANEAPSAMARGPDRIELFVRAVNGSLYWRTWQGGSWLPNWRLVTDASVGWIDSRPSVASIVSNRLELFVKSTQNELMHRTFASGAWSSWVKVLDPRPIPASLVVGPFASAPFTVGVSGCCVNVWGLDPSRRPVEWTLFGNGGWNARGYDGPRLRAPPTSAHWKLSHQLVYAWGDNGNLWLTWFDQAWASRWVDTAIALGAAPVAGTIRPGTLHVLAVDPQGKPMRVVYGHEAECPALDRSQPAANFCADPSCPCAHGQGHCENDAQCAGDLRCGNSNGSDFGLPADFNVCIAACGQSGHCSAQCPCTEDTGPCMSDRQCDCGLVCKRQSRGAATAPMSCQRP